MLLRHNINMVFLNKFKYLCLDPEECCCLVVTPEAETLKILPPGSFNLYTNINKCFKNMNHYLLITILHSIKFTTSLHEFAFNVIGTSSKILFIHDKYQVASRLLI